MSSICVTLIGKHFFQNQNDIFLFLILIDQKTNCFLSSVSSPACDGIKLTGIVVTAQVGSGAT